MSTDTRPRGTAAPTLVTGASGIIGRRVVAQLRARGQRCRAGSRSGEPPFDLTDPRTWDASLTGARHLVLISPEGVPIHPDFLTAAAAAGVERLALLSDRAVEVMGVDRLLAAEQLVHDSGLGWTVVRSDWFDQNFDESFFHPGIVAGVITVPLGEVRQGFVDADDVAAVLVQSLLDDAHLGRTYRATGPAALSFAEAVGIIGRACGRAVCFAGDVESYRRGRAELGADPAETQREIDRFAALSAEGDALPSPDVERVTGRPAVPFEVFARRAAAQGAWPSTGSA